MTRAPKGHKMGRVPGSSRADGVGAVTDKEWIMGLRLNRTGHLAFPLLIVATLVVGSARDTSASPASDQAASDGIVADGVAAGLPGVVLAAQRTGEDEVVSGAGVSSRERGTPLAATDRFRIYS